MTNAPDPSRIMQTATAFWASKVLLTAVECGVFTVLGQGSMDAVELGSALGLHPRGTFDFFDALVALRFLERDGDGPSGRYRNTIETGAFLDKASPTYIGGMPEMLNARLFGFWNDLGPALRTGKPQNEVKHSGRSFFEGLYANQAQLGAFLSAMNGFQTGNFMALAEKFDFSCAQSVLDVGGALGLLSCLVGTRHPHLQFTSFDLPPVAAHARQQITTMGMTDRVTVVSGDFFADDLPKADIVTMGNILHDWNLEKKKTLIAKAFAALPTGGALIAIENLIDDARREHVFGLLMSLNMLIEFGDAFDYTFADFQTWCRAAGFTRFDVISLAGPTSAAIAYK